MMNGVNTSSGPKLLLPVALGLFCELGAKGVHPVGKVALWRCLCSTARREEVSVLRAFYLQLLMVLWVNVTKKVVVHISFPRPLGNLRYRSYST